MVSTTSGDVPGGCMLLTSATLIQKSTVSARLPNPSTFKMLILTQEPSFSWNALKATRFLTPFPVCDLTQFMHSCGRILQ